MRNERTVLRRARHQARTPTPAARADNPRPPWRAGRRDLLLQTTARRGRPRREAVRSAAAVAVGAVSAELPAPSLQLSGFDRRERVPKNSFVTLGQSPRVIQTRDPPRREARRADRGARLAPGSVRASLRSRRFARARRAAAPGRPPRAAPPAAALFESRRRRRADGAAMAATAAAPAAPSTPAPGSRRSDARTLGNACGPLTRVVSALPGAPPRRRHVRWARRRASRFKNHAALARELLAGL